MRAASFCVLVLATAILPALPGGAVQGSGLDRPAFLEEKAPVLAPFAFVRFCLAAPSECAMKHGAGEVRDDIAADIAAINRSVNHAIVPRRDRPGQDLWTLSPRAGDCEDYAVTKRRKLIEHGLPARAIRLAVGLTPDGRGHAVVIVRTRNGDLVLDNRSDAVKRADEVDLVWMKIESADNPKWWYAL